MKRSFGDCYIKRDAHKCFAFVTHAHHDAHDNGSHNFRVFEGRFKALPADSVCTASPTGYAQPTKATDACASPRCTYRTTSSYCYIMARKDALNTAWKNERDQTSKGEDDGIEERNVPFQPRTSAGQTLNCWTSGVMQVLFGQLPGRSSHRKGMASL